MAGKYAQVVARLQRLSEEPTYQAKVNAVKAAIVAEEEYKPHASHLAQRYADKRIEKEAIEEVLSQCQLELTAIEQLMIDQYEVEGTSSLRLEDGPSIGVQPEPYAQVADRERYYKWCIDEGLGPQMQLPWQTTNSLTKERLLNGEEPPPGVTAFVRTKIVMRK